MYELFSPASDESDDIARLHEGIDALCAKHATPRLVGVDGTDVEIPPSIFDALKLAVDAMSRGATITLMPHGRELSSQEAADLMRVSRPHLIKLLDRGEMPFHRVGRHRRIRIEDVLAYLERRREERDLHLTELAQAAQDAGGYD